MAPGAHPTRELIQSFFPPEERATSAVRSLASIVEEFLGTEDLGPRLDAFVELKEWTTTRLPSPAGNRMSRLETFLALMELRSGGHQSLQIDISALPHQEGY